MSEIRDFADKHGVSELGVKELQTLVNASMMLSQRRVAVRVPASVANLGPGMDSCGLAVDIWDEFTVEHADRFIFEATGCGAETVPRTEENPVVVGAACAYRVAGRALPPLKYTCNLRIPYAKGLGSSSASFVGGYLAGSVLVAEELATLPRKTSPAATPSQEELPTMKRPPSGLFLKQRSGSIENNDTLTPSISTGSFKPPPRDDAPAGVINETEASEVSSHGERRDCRDDCGTEVILQQAIAKDYNPANICPAVYGGLQIGVEGRIEGWQSHRVPVPKGLVCAIFVPEGLDEGERVALTKPLDRADAIFNVGRTAVLINAFCKGDFTMLGLAMEDTLHQPQETQRYPHITPVIKAAVAAGAAGACVSGNGPSVMALITGRSGDVLAQSSFSQVERDVAKAMLETAKNVGTSGQVLIAKPADVGAHVVAQKSDLSAADSRVVYFQ